MSHLHSGTFLSLALALLVLSGCSTVKSGDKTTPAAGAGATATPAAATAAGNAPGSAVAYGAAVGTDGLTSTNLANAQRAAAAGLGQGQNLVHFDYDSDALSDAAIDLLRRHADFLKANPGIGARLEGHTDERGTYEYNVALGERRGQVVAAFLKAHGVDGRRLEVVSYGELKPVTTAHDEAAWATNRRVELLYL